MRRQVATDAVSPEYIGKALIEQVRACHGGRSSFAAHAHACLELQVVHAGVNHFDQIHGRAVARVASECMVSP